MNSPKLPPTNPKAMLWRAGSSRTAYQKEIGSIHRILLVFLVDHSRACAAAFDEDKTIDKEISRQVQDWLQRTVISCSTSKGFHNVDIALIGYRSDAYGRPVVRPAWIGPLAGRERVPIGEVEGSPARLDEVLWCMQDEETGENIEMPAQVPVWHDPVAEGEAPLCSAIAEACRIVDEWIPQFPESFPPIVVTITSGVFSDGDPWPYADALRRRGTQDGPVLLLNEYITGAEGVRPLLFPDDSQKVSNNSARTLFACSSHFPPSLMRSFRFYGQEISPHARCFSVNASLVSFITSLLSDDDRAIYDW